MNDETLLSIDNDSDKYVWNTEINESSDKKQVITFMVESMNKDNLELGLKSGMSEDNIKKQIQNSQQTLMFMMSNIYDKLVEANLIVV